LYDKIQTETTTYVAQYINDRYGKNVTQEEVFRKLPWHKIVWQSFFADAYYKKKSYYFRWEDVPEPAEGDLAYIISKEVLERYLYRNGRWCNLGEATADCWK
jgi:hypothetical protein